MDKDMYVLGGEIYARNDPQFEDRRIFARFTAELSLQYANENSTKQFQAVTRDVCAKGIGIFTNERLTPDSYLTISLKMPDNSKDFSTRGRVIWSEQIEPDKYRVGIDLEKAELMGISIVLRTIQIQTRYYC
jgi:hypothetical protein